VIKQIPTAMGMTAGVYRASSAEIQDLIDHPESVGPFLESAMWAPPTREVRPKGLLGWLLKLTPVSIHETDPDAEPPPGYDKHDDRPHCDLEGTWHGLHFLFTGTAWDGEEPACYLLKGGENVGDADELGYSVLQALSPARTQQFAGYLRSLSHQELERRYDPERMSALEIYPGTWSRNRNDHPALEDLLTSYGDLHEFIDATVEAKAGVVVYVT
jgi:Domain of unknown function (DUF1877)